MSITMISTPYRACLGTALASLLVGAASAQSPRPDDRASAPATAVRPAHQAHVKREGCQPPNYPVDAARQQVQGTSHLRFAIDATGKVIDAEIAHPSGATHAHRLLDQAALGAFAKCDFQPALDEQGQPVADSVEMSYTWVLE